MFTNIKTFEDACLALGYDASVPSFDNAPVKHRKALQAHYKLMIIIEAINEGWQPNWNDSDEFKYELWPDVIEDKNKPSGFGLSCDDYVTWLTITNVGSRLCFSSRERAKHCFNQFLQLWEDYFLIDK